MKLLTKEIEKRFNQLGSQDNDNNPVVVTKFFTPYSSWTWLVIAYDEKSGEFFVHASDGHGEGELGYLTQEEITSFGNDIEREIYWKECRLDEARKREGI